MKKLFLTFTVAALAFTACNNNDNNFTPVSDLPITSGTVSSAPTTLMTVAAVADNQISTIIIKSASFVQGTGFSMTLPGILPNQTILRPFYATVNDIPTGVTISNRAARYVPVFFRGNDVSGNEIGVLTYENITATTETDILYWYVDRHVEIMGTYTNTDNQFVTYNLTLSRGWNKISVHTDAEHSTVTYTSPITGQITADWRFNSEIAMDLPLSAIPYTGTDITNFITLSAYTGTAKIVDGTLATAPTTFTITLPAAPNSASLATLIPFYATAGDVPEGVIIDNMAAKYFNVNFVGYDAAPAINGYLVNQSGLVGPNITRILYWYVDSEVTIIGNDLLNQVVWNVHLMPGWNQVLRSASASSLTYTSPLPTATNIPWIYAVGTTPI